MSAMPFKITIYDGFRTKTKSFHWMKSRDDEARRLREQGFEVWTWEDASMAADYSHEPDYV